MFNFMKNKNGNRNASSIGRGCRGFEVFNNTIKVRDLQRVNNYPDYGQDT